MPDALVCFNDELAIAAMRRVYELGCRVPGQIAIVGIDGVKETELAAPILTTVAPDKAILAVQDVVVPHRLFVRESAADTSTD